MVKKRDYWKTTEWPTMEFTTTISPKGCIVNCAFCPQRTLEKIYHAHEGQPKILSLDNFTHICDKLPQEVRVTFSGFTEPWLNKDCSKMVEYAHQKGHPVSAFSTGVGMTLEDVEIIKDIPWTEGPNGGFCLHIPDQERIAEHPLSARLYSVFEKFKEYENDIQGFYVMSMGEPHNSVKDLWPNPVIPNFWSRAGNLIGEAQIKPALDKIKDRFQHKEQHQPSTCACIEHLYHNVVLPNGDVSLCCMDYSLEKILGNMFTDSYDDIMPAPLTTFDICGRCENGCSPSDKIKNKNIII
jgi:hypothetical protein|tara:strand:- start:762 stop:1652 length:891 start_codon:yes stop_codon:yes gene_type:complete